MIDEAVSRRRENAAFFLRILAFGLIFTLISCAVLYVLTPKYDYGPGSMMNLPLQPRNTIDVLAVGTSTTYAAVNTNVLWANWGFSVYDLASAEQQYWHTYYYLEQALTTQHPKILLLDTKAATYPDDTARAHDSLHIRHFEPDSPRKRDCRRRSAAAGLPAGLSAGA